MKNDPVILLVEDDDLAVTLAGARPGADEGLADVAKTAAVEPRLTAVMA